MYRFLALDIDGTLLTDQGELVDRDRRAVAMLQNEGVHVTLITGRLFSGTLPIARTLAIPHAVGVMNGSELREVQDGSRLAGDYLCRSTRTLARTVLRDTHLSPFVFSSDHLHHCPRGTPWRPAMRAWSEHFVEHPDVLDAPLWDQEDGVLALVGVGEEAAVQEASLRMNGQLPHGTEVLTFAGFHYPVHFLNLRSRIQDKGTALHRLAERVGCTVDACVAVGDWLNDVPMLKVAGHSFAMGQAPEAVHEHATERLESTSARGGAVAEVAERIWGLRVP
jgi:Cof subfamily protein (haloacid dehalogenase superfamily)